ncbi:MAG: bifunctional acyl-ACP--phospholipid O-acyltransferase/long-chain-fatty-acid--ACP ligase [Proteobacteria bacterium]|nr:bifunctional acyl-ACP--phospholipid O-acyltransferase/long-chain-fatty-acid--ACP ligase [Pseudomonadota bacterium]
MNKTALRLLLKTFARGLFRVRIEGDLGQLNNKRLLIVANHESFLDGVLLGLFLPVNPVFVVHTAIAQKRFFKMVLSFVDYLTVDPASPMAMKKIVRLVEAGRPVVIFPEGRITITGSLMKVYDGPAFVAAKTGASVVPVRLDGPARSYFSRLSGRYPKRLFPRVTLSVQPATTVTMPVGGKARDRRRQAGEHLRRIMQEMMFRSRPAQTLFSAFVDAGSVYGWGRAMMEDIQGGEKSYRDLLKMSLALGRLSARHTAPGENVGVLLPNLATTFGLLFGLSAQGRIPALLNYSAGADALSAACVAACVKTVFTSRAFLEKAKLGWIPQALPDVRIIFLEDLKTGLRWQDKAWITLGLLFPRLATGTAQPDDPAVVLFTSGSEGRPKGVVLSHRAILSNIAQILAVVDFSVEDKMLNALPVFHSFGLTVGGLLPILGGANLFLYPSPLHYRVIPEIVYDRNCTVLLGTSTFLGNYAKQAHPYDFYRLRHVVSGAEKLTETVRGLWFEKFGIRILDGYGATETAPVLSVNTPMAYKTGTVGQLLPAVEGRLVPVPGIESGGELHVRGPNLMLGYYRFEKPGVIEPPVSELGEGWYATGDIVDINAEGFVTIVGRIKRFAKVAGEMISLEAVERLGLATSPESQHGALAVPDAQKGEAIILCTTDPELTPDRLIQTARTQGFPELAVPRRIVYLSELPLLGSGKVNYPKLREMAGA